MLQNELKREKCNEKILKSAENRSLLGILLNQKMIVIRKQKMK